MTFSVSHIERRLAAHRPNELARLGEKRAAVACLVRAAGASSEVLLMKRAEHPGDRWSGHVSFPGGREEPGDPELRATAVRETREEVGIDLHASARFVGQLDTIRAVAAGRIRPLTITPFVFVETEPVTPRLNHEAVAAFWLPLERAASGELQAEYPYQLGPVQRLLPCWHYAGHVIWGLTFQMLGQLIELIESSA